MSDFLLDFRRPQDRTAAIAEQQIKWFSDLVVQAYECAPFSLVVSRCDDPRHWAPYQDPESNVIVAVTGRLACDEEVWREASLLPGEGGMAAKLICMRYAKNQRLEDLLNGAFTVLICDPASGKVIVITDRCGMCPVYYATVNGLVLSSHTDVLSSAVRHSSNYDSISMAEFLMTGRISYPFTYYKTIQALELGSVYECRADHGAKPVKKRSYFTLAYRPAPSSDADNLVERLGNAFRRAVQRRTLPRFGKTAISLSGGLDSRTLLCCRDDHADTLCFTFYDEENYEFRTASRIAHTLGVPLIPLQRKFEHYAQSAALGIRIQGGMGTFANNHFLGFRESVRELGVTNVLAGFYCDYLFKGLGLDKVGGRFTGLDRFCPFSLQWYRPRFLWPTELCRQAEDRHLGLFADVDIRDDSDIGRLRVEGKRLFPLAYEPDNAETVTTQRIFPWYLPTVDTDLIEVYQELPPGLKLNNRVFAQMVIRECGRKVASIPDANTGLPVGQLGIAYALKHLYVALARRVRQSIWPRIATEGSWQNWEYYTQHSPLLEQIWRAAPLSEEDVFEQVLGRNPLERNIRSFKGREAELLVRLLTLRLWFRHRVV